LTGSYRVVDADGRLKRQGADVDHGTSLRPSIPVAVRVAPALAAEVAFACLVTLLDGKPPSPVITVLFGLTLIAVMAFQEHVESGSPPSATEPSPRDGRRIE
jgi:hypothetical protein